MPILYYRKGIKMLAYKNSVCLEFNYDPYLYKIRSYNSYSLRFFKGYKTQLLTDPAILVLGVYPREIKMYTDTKTCTQIFTAIFPKKVETGLLSING